MSLKKVAPEDYIHDPKSPGYTTFMEFCKKQNSHDYLLCFTHFNNKMLKEQAENYEKFMILFDEAWEKFLKINSKQRVSLGDEHGKNEAALQKCFDKYWEAGNPRCIEYFLPPPEELVSVVKKHARDPLQKTIKQGPFADFKLDKSFQEIPNKIRVDDQKALKFVLDPESDGYTIFMEFCKKQNSHDYLLCFTHFNNRMIEETPDYETFMKRFDSAWKKFLHDNAKQSVGLGSDHAKHIDALQSCFAKYWAKGKLVLPS